MASGSITGSTNNRYITPTIRWSSVTNISGNYSDVTATLYYKKSSQSTAATYGTLSCKLTINGASSSASKTVTLACNNTDVQVLTATVRVYHNNDGSKSITISATGGISGTTFTSTSCSGTVTLDTIPRASSVSAGNMTMGTAANITITPAASGFTHTLTYKFGSATGTIVTKTGSNSVSWTPPLSLASQIPSATSGTLTITCTTYSGDTAIGTSTCTVTLSVPASVVPSISAVAVSEGTAGLASQFGCYVQNKSTLAVAITAAGVYGSAIRSYSTTFQSKSYSGSSFTTSAPTASGTLNLVTTVTDTRGRTATQTTAVTVVAYANPAINGFSAVRCDSNGDEDSDGDYVKLTYDYAVSPVNNRNTAEAKVEYKRSSASAWESTALYQSANYSGSGTVVPATALSADFGWDLRLTVTDYFTSATYTRQILSALYGVDFILDSSGETMGVAFGKAAEHVGRLDSAWPIYAEGSKALTTANVQSGQVSTQIAAGDTYADYSVTFPTAFDSTPRIMLTEWTTTDTQQNVCIPVLKAASATGFSFRIWRQYGTPTTTNPSPAVHWLAVSV